MYWTRTRKDVPKVEFSIHFKDQSSLFHVDRQLRIITGAGKHSRGGIGVLLPAVYKQLTHEGWDVRKFEAGIIVSGKLSV